jgi:hypothetical protein
MPEHINPQLILQDHFNNLKTGLRKEIDSLTKPPIDRTAFRFSLFEKYGLKPLKIGAIEPAGKKTKNVSKRLLGDRWVEKVQEIKVVINYEGDKILFNCKPVNYSRVFPAHRHILYIGVIVMYIELPEYDETLYNKELAAFILEITKNIERTNTQTEFFNEELPRLIDNLLKSKEESFNKEASFFKKIGLNINPRSDEYMIPSPVKRKTIPLPSAEKISGIATPYLESKVYNDIREVLYHVGQAIERKPSLYRGKKEEDLRDIFLLFLETRYESTAGAGEAFNKKGKTDILLKYSGDGSNVFVAECKVWQGQKNLFEAIDQLLGYLTWRDSKTALMLFVKQPDASKAIEVVAHYVNRHPQFKRFVGATHNTSFAYEMTLPGDSDISIWMEFMLFHFPA